MHAGEELNPAGGYSRGVKRERYRQVYMHTHICVYTRIRLSKRAGGKERRISPAGEKRMRARAVMELGVAGGGEYMYTRARYRQK